MARFKKVIIDADMIPYAVGFAAKGEPLAHALQTVKHKLNKIVKECDAEERELYVGGIGNFREDVATTRGYKAHRKASDKPDHYADIKDYLINVQGAVVCDGWEADDAVSLELYKDYVASGGDREVSTLVLSSGDKDLNNTPGWHHKPTTGEIVWYSDLQATRHFLYQMIMGDMTDNIKGLPSLPLWVFKSYKLNGTKGGAVGKATARALMNTTKGVEDAEELVYKLYLEWGWSQGIGEDLVKEYIVEQGQLLWMVRELDSSGNPVMWNINGEIYERARRQTEYSRVQTEGKGDPYSTAQVGGGSDTVLGGGEDGYTYESGASLRIKPPRHS